jgi:hypothetical protein
MIAPDPMIPTVTLSQAKRLILMLGGHHCLFLLAAPGVGKSEVVAQVAAEAGLELRWFLGTQIAPEDVSGIPHIVGNRAVYCPPGSLVSDDGRPFLIFFDEFLLSPTDVQKALTPIILDRRIGEHRFPEGTIIVVASNRPQDLALVRSMSSALMNRVIVLHVRAEVTEWIKWACENHVRPEIVAFISCCPEALSRPVQKDAPFSTPRAWVSLARALDGLEAGGAANEANRTVLAFGCVSAEDAATFCAVASKGECLRQAPEAYLLDPQLLPDTGAARWLVLQAIRDRVARGKLGRVPRDRVAAFLAVLPAEHRFSLIVGLVEEWGRIGASSAFRKSLREVLGS